MRVKLKCDKAKTRKSKLKNGHVLPDVLGKKVKDPEFSKNCGRRNTRLLKTVLQMNRIVIERKEWEVQKNRKSSTEYAIYRVIIKAKHGPFLRFFTGKMSRLILRSLGSRTHTANHLSRKPLVSHFFRGKK